MLCATVSHPMCRADVRRCKCNADLIRRIALRHARMAFLLPKFATHFKYYLSKDAFHFIAAGQEPVKDALRIQSPFSLLKGLQRPLHVT